MLAHDIRTAILFFFLSFFYLYWEITDKGNCIFLKYTTWRFYILIHCGLIIKIKVINTSITPQSNCVSVCVGVHVCVVRRLKILLSATLKCTVKCVSRHAVHEGFRTYFSYNWKPAPFELQRFIPCTRPQSPFSFSLHSFTFFTSASCEVTFLETYPDP